MESVRDSPVGKMKFGNNVCLCWKQNKSNMDGTARSVEDETWNAELNGNRNHEWWGDFSLLQIQIKPKSQLEFVLQDTSELKSNQNLNLTWYREIPRNLIFSIWTSWLKSLHHSGFRLPFDSEFRFSSSTIRAVIKTEMRTLRGRVFSRFALLSRAIK